MIILLMSRLTSFEGSLEFLLLCWTTELPCYGLLSLLVCSTEVGKQKYNKSRRYIISSDYCALQELIHSGVCK